jgi:predicted Zn-dependent protease
LQVVSLAGQGKFQEARDMLQKLSATSPPELLRILDGIAPLQSDDREDPFHTLGDLQLEAALRLDRQRSELSAPEQRRLDECLARAYVATRQPARGIEIYEKLLDRAPRDKPLLTAYAELLVKCATKDCLKKALGAWQKLEAMQKAATPEWFALRYQVCRTLVLMDDFTEAGKLLKVTRLLYPKVEDERWQQKFAELEAQCTKAAIPKEGNGRKPAPM